MVVLFFWIFFLFFFFHSFFFFFFGGFYHFLHTKNSESDYFLILNFNPSWFRNCFEPKSAWQAGIILDAMVKGSFLDHTLIFLLKFHVDFFYFQPLEQGLLLSANPVFLHNKVPSYGWRVSTLEVPQTLCLKTTKLSGNTKPLVAQNLRRFL